MNIKCVSESNQSDFEAMCQDLINDGYKLSSSSCGFVNSDQYDFCDSWQAIFYKENPDTYQQKRTIKQYKIGGKYHIGSTIYTCVGFEPCRHQGEVDRSLSACLTCKGSVKFEYKNNAFSECGYLGREMRHLEAFESEPGGQPCESGTMN